MNELVLSPTDFVAIANQTLEHVFGRATIEGELSNFRVSKNKWLYFDLKDEYSKVACFASIYALPGPLEDGMVVRVTGTPRLHPQFGFSITVQNITPAGEGSIKKAFLLLKQKLTAEGLFDDERKRQLPTIPQTIALVASVESAAYADFIKILSVRWPFVTVQVFDTNVQGWAAPEQLARAITKANEQADLADVLVVTRGGGSADDLNAFNDERVVRAIAASRIPSIVAIGHEVDESLSELATDLRASTPSNAAELIVPDRQAERAQIVALRNSLNSSARSFVDLALADLRFVSLQLRAAPIRMLETITKETEQIRHLLSAYNPRVILERGYALVKKGDQLLASVCQAGAKDILQIELSDGSLDVIVTDVRGKLKK